MNIEPIYIIASTIVFTIITLVPFAVPTIVINWGIRATCAVLAIIGWYLTFRSFK